jgi:iron complex transport system ATP-binding protein
MSKDDHEMIQWAIQVTGMTAFADHPVDQLSGGQRQRAWIAMALAQGTDLLFLDEPTTFLDMAHQLEVLKLLEKLNQDQQRTIVMVVHDLNHASRFAQHMVAIKSGKVTACGSPVEVITPDVMREVFGIEADIVTDPRTGLPLCLPYELAGESYSGISSRPSATNVKEPVTLQAVAAAQ